MYSSVGHLNEFDKGLRVASLFVSSWIETSTTFQYLCHYARIVTKGNRPGIMSSLKRPIRINDSARCLSSLQDKTHFFLSCQCNRSELPKKTGHGVWPQGTMHPKGNEDTRENRAFIHNSSSMSFRTASDRGRSETAKRVDVLCVID
jgi:hypothetical protein